MASLGDKAQGPIGTTYTYGQIISRPAYYEPLEVQGWAWAAGLYANSGLTSATDPKATVDWYLTMTEANVRRVVLQDLPALRGEVAANKESLSVQLAAAKTELLDVIDQVADDVVIVSARISDLHAKLDALTAKVDALATGGVTAAEIVTELRKQIGLAP